LYLGLDLGTSGATALLLDDRLAVVARSARPIQTQYPRPGWVEQEPEGLLAAVQQVGIEVLAGLASGTTVVAGFANPGESVLAWDVRSGEPLTPVMVWSDSRSAVICDRLRADGFEVAITELSGLRLDPYFCAAKFAWLLEHDARVQAASRLGVLRLCTLDAWIAFQLSGEYVTDHSTASRTQLYDQACGCWSTELMEMFGIPPGVLPDIRPGLSPFGSLTLGSHRVPWTAALIDQVAALVGNGCLTPGEVKVTYGTGAFVLVQGGTAPPAPESTLIRSVGLSGAQGRQFILDGGVYSAGSAVHWLEDLGVLRKASEASRLAENASGDRVRFLPAFSGLGAPWWQAEARGVLSGLSGQVGRGEIVRAVLDGIASSVSDIFDEAALTLGPLWRVRADGGLAQNRYLMQRQADLSGLIIERSAEHEATALGMALVAGIGIGALHWEQVRERVSSMEVFTPRLSEPERLRDRASWRDWLARAAGLNSEG